MEKNVLIDFIYDCISFPADSHHTHMGGPLQMGVDALQREAGVSGAKTTYTVSGGFLPLTSIPPVPTGPTIRGSVQSQEGQYLFPGVHQWEHFSEIV